VAPAIVAQGLAVSLAMSLVALAVSSLSRSARVAGLSFFALLAGLEMARGILVHVVEAEWATLLSLQANLRAMAARLFGLSTRGAEADPLLAALWLGAAMAASLLVLRARVRAVEIVR
jgi:hypothetical protein